MAKDPIEIDDKYDSAPAQQLPLGSSKTSTSKTPADTRSVLDRLKEPFHPRLVKWRVVSTSAGQAGKVRGQVAAYVHWRCYVDRLNNVLGPNDWTRDYEIVTVTNFERGKEKLIAAKVMVVCRLTVQGATHCGTGECWADDENALARAEARAFRHACSCFGLGRYLYDIDRSWVELDQFKRPKTTPQLPEWALPAPGGRGTGSKEAAA